MWNAFLQSSCFAVEIKHLILIFANLFPCSAAKSESSRFGETAQSAASSSVPRVHVHGTLRSCTVKMIQSVDERTRKTIAF